MDSSTDLITKEKNNTLFRYPQNIPISSYLNGSVNKQSVL
jgi:hypothetical protein